jgi:acyl transferase domain-containing protein
MAVVSGCNLMLSPDQFKTFSSMGMVSPDGISYTFDSRANGYGRGEGVGTLVLKRLRYGVSVSSAPTYLGLSNA